MTLRLVPDLSSDLPSRFPYKKVAVVGGAGMLGFDLTTVLAPLTTVVAFSSGQLDLHSSEAEMYQTLEPLQCDLIINAAAYTNVDKAEDEPEVADAVNHLGAAKLAKVSSLLEIPMVQISTDYVFDGESSVPYLPSDKPNPISVYGKTKYDGELAVQKFCPESWIVRTSWLYGGTKKHFVRYILDNAATKSPLKIVDDWTGAPTWTVNLAKMIALIAAEGSYGIYHAVDGSCVSKYQQACDIYQHLGLDSALIEPVSYASFNFKARRPAFSALNSQQLALMDWQQAFKNYHQTIGSIAITG